jgi:hypothetical protein
MAGQLWYGQQQPRSSMTVLIYLGYEVEVHPTLWSSSKGFSATPEGESQQALCIILAHLQTYPILLIPSHLSVSIFPHRFSSFLVPHRQGKSAGSKLKSWSLLVCFREIGSFSLGVGHLVFFHFLFWSKSRFREVRKIGGCNKF